MSRTIFSLVGRIRTEGLDTLSKGLLDIDKRLTQTARHIDRFGRNVAKIGTNITKITAPIGVVAAASVKFGADFEKAMTNSLAIMGNVSDEMRGKMSTAARDVAKTSTFSAREAAESYYFLASAGMSAAQSIEGLPRVTKFAQAGNFDLALATDLLTDAQSALGLSSKDTATSMANMTRVSDVLVKANTLANASVQQFSEALTNKAGAALRLLGKEVEEGAAVLAVYADQGNKGAGAGESLNIVLRDLQRANVENRKAFDAAGISVFDASGEMRNMADIVSDLEKYLGGMSDEQKRTALTMLGFQERSISATASLIGTSEAIRRYEQELRNAAGITEDVAAKQLKSFWAQLELLKNKLIDVAIGLSETLIPILKDQVVPIIENVVNSLANLFNWFRALPDSVQKTVIGITAFVAISGPFLIGLGKMISSITMLTTSFKALRFILMDVGRFMKAHPILLMASAFVTLAGTILSTVRATKEQIKQQEKLNTVQDESETMEQRRNQLRKEFIRTMKEAQGFMSAANESEARGLKNSIGYYKLYFERTEKAVGIAQQLGYTIKGNTAERAKAAVAIEHEIRQIRDANGNLTTYNQTTKNSVATMEERTKALDGWLRKIAEQEASEMELIEIKRKAAKEDLDAKDRNAKTLQAIDTYYDGERKKLEEVQAERLYENARQAGKAAGSKRDAELLYLESVRISAAEASGRQLEALDMRIAAEKRAAEETLSIKSELDAALRDIDDKYEKERTQLVQQQEDERNRIRQGALLAEKFLNDQRVSMALSQVNMLAEIGRNDTQNKLTRIQQELDADKKRIQESSASEAEKEVEIAKIEAEAEKRQRALRRRQAKRDKMAAIFNAGITAIQVALNGFNTQPFVPLGLIMGGVATALGAGLVASMAAKPLPELAEGGTARRREGGTPVIVGEGLDDEAILPMKKGADEIARGITKRIGGQDEIVSSMERVVGGLMNGLVDRLNQTAPSSGASATSRVNNLNVGVLIGDQRAYKELERRLNSVRLEENRRKGI